MPSNHNWGNKKTCPLTKTSRAYRYSDVKAKDGWISIAECLPISYDLMHLKLAKAVKAKLDGGQVKCGKAYTSRAKTK